MIKVEKFVAHFKVDLSRVYLKDHIWRHKHNDAVNERLTLLYEGWTGRVLYVRKVLGIPEEHYQ